MTESHTACVHRLGQRLAAQPMGERPASRLAVPTDATQLANCLCSPPWKSSWTSVVMQVLCFAKKKNRFSELIFVFYGSGEMRGSQDFDRDFWMDSSNQVTNLGPLQAAVLTLLLKPPPQPAQVAPERSKLNGPQRLTIPSPVALLAWASETKSEAIQSRVEDICLQDVQPVPFSCMQHIQNFLKRKQPAAM